MKRAHVAVDYSITSPGICVHISEDDVFRYENCTFLSAFPYKEYKTTKKDGKHLAFAAKLKNSDGNYIFESEYDNIIIQDTLDYVQYDQHSQFKRFSSLANALIFQLGGLLVDCEVVSFTIESLSNQSKGRILDLSENAGIFKLIFDQTFPNVTYHSYAPSEMKKFAKGFLFESQKLERDDDGDIVFSKTKLPKRDGGGFKPANRKMDKHAMYDAFVNVTKDDFIKKLKIKNTKSKYDSLSGDLVDAFWICKLYMESHEKIPMNVLS